MAVACAISMSATICTGSGEVTINLTGVPDTFGGSEIPRESTVPTGPPRSFHQERRAHGLESVDSAEVEEAFLLVHAHDTRVIDRRAVQHQRHVSVRGHIDGDGNRA